jgi:DNA anti-recombination protein RmuC
MKKKIIKKKMTIEDLSDRMDKGFKEVNRRIGHSEQNLHDRVDNLRDHMNRKFDEQTDEISGQIQDVLELVDNRFKPLERVRRL